MTTYVRLDEYVRGLVGIKAGSAGDGHDEQRVSLAREHQGGLRIVLVPKQKVS